MKIPRPIIPKEHGAWAVLIVSMGVASSIAGRVSMEFLFLAISALFVFMSYVPVHTLLRHVFMARQAREKTLQAMFWSAAYAGVGVAFIVPVLGAGYLMLLPIGMLGLVSFFGNFFLARRNPKTLMSDLLAVAGLSLGAPSAWYVLTGNLDRQALALWLLNFLFFGCSVFYVHMKIRATSLKKTQLEIEEKLTLGKLNLLYHALVLVIVGLLALEHFTVQFAIIAFVPMAIHAFYGTYTLSGRVRFKNLGFLLLAQSVVFALILILWGVAV